MLRVVVAMILTAVLAVPAAAQDLEDRVTRLEDRMTVNTLIGPGFVGDGVTLNVRAAAGIKANDWLAFVGEWGNLGKASSTTVRDDIAGQHINGNVRFTTRRPLDANLRPYATVGVGAFRTSEGILGAGTRSDFATNVGAGIMYEVNRWLGLGFDYRRFFVDYDDDLRGVNRYTFGFNFGLR